MFTQAASFSPTTARAMVAATSAFGAVRKTTTNASGAAVSVLEGMRVQM